MWSAKRWPTAFFVLVLTVWILASAIQPSQPGPFQDSPSPEKRESDKQPQRDWTPIFNRIMVLLTLILAATSIVVARRSADTAERQLRAYINVESVTIKFPVPNSVEIILRFRNFGRTPAYDVRIEGAIGVAPYPWIDPGRTPKPAEQRGVVGPNVQFLSFPHMEKLEEEVVEQMRKPEFAIWTYGEVLYRDAFRRQRYTRYRLYCGGPERIISHMQFDREGNESN